MLAINFEIILSLYLLEAFYLWPLNILIANYFFFYVVLSGDWGNLFGIIYSFCT